MANISNWIKIHYTNCHHKKQKTKKEEHSATLFSFEAYYTLEILSALPLAFGLVNSLERWFQCLLEERVGEAFVDSSSRPVVLKIGRYSSSANGPFHFQLFLINFSWMNSCLFLSTTSVLDLSIPCNFL